MSDFVIIFGNRIDPKGIESQLRDRPGLQDRPVLCHEFDWGVVISQESANPFCAPLICEDELWCCAGRPYFSDGWCVGVSDDSTMREVLRRWLSSGVEDVSRVLSGMYVIARCSAEGVDILTDQMGFRPVYTSYDTAGGLGSIGTLVEATAKAGGREYDFDEISLSELLIDGRITFPYTSRQGVTELGPCGIHRVSRSSSEKWRINSTTLWEPTERLSGCSRDELSEALEVILCKAGDDITRGLDRVAFTLSGGWDSRGILVSLPAALQAEAITFVTRENRESQIAHLVAETAGILHHYALRGSDYFAEMLPHSIDLIGMELRANANGYCIVENGFDRTFQLILGGQLCDTFLKDHFLPADIKEQFRPKHMRERISTLLRNLGILPKRHPRDRIDYRSAICALVRPDLVEAVHDRQRVRLAEVQRVRPESGVEWNQFWPASRQNDAGHNLTNSRLYASDSLYMHRDIVCFATGLPAEIRYGGKLVKQTFRRMFGDLNDIPIANTGVPPSAGDRVEERVVHQRFRKGEHLKFQQLSASDHPWNDVQTSWNDSVVMQKLSPQWCSYREHLRHSASLEVLAKMMVELPEQFVMNYEPRISSVSNLIFIQIVMALDRVLVSETAAC